MVWKLRAENPDEEDERDASKQKRQGRLNSPNDRNEAQNECRDQQCQRHLGEGPRICNHELPRESPSSLARSAKKNGRESPQEDNGCRDLQQRTDRKSVV